MELPRQYHGSTNVLTTKSIPGTMKSFSRYATLAENTANGCADAALTSELRELWAFVGKQFGLSREVLLSEADDDDENQPVYVVED